MNQVKVKHTFFLAIFISTIFFAKCQETEQQFEEVYPRLLFREIGSHFAFTDLIFFENRWYLTFRSSDKHVGGKNGSIMVYSSADFINWTKENEFTVSGIDLRDPNLFVWDEELHIKLHGTKFTINGDLVGFREYVSTLSMNNKWQDLRLVENAYESWLWKFFSVEGRLLSLGYEPELNSKPTSSVISLFEIVSEKAVKICDLPLTGYFNEGIIREVNGKSIAIIRNEYGKLFVGEIDLENCELVTYDFPLDIKGGMNAAVLNDEVIRIIGRVNQRNAPSIISVDYSLWDREVIRIDSIESGGDCGYPGVVNSDSVVYLSYYSTHIGNGIFINKLYNN